MTLELIESQFVALRNVHLLDDDSITQEINFEKRIIDILHKSEWLNSDDDFLKFLAKK